MKKGICLLLAVQIVAASAPTGQGVHTLFKIGALAHHFVHHLVCQHEHIGVVDFLTLHYLDPVHHEADHGEHQHLPFQHHHHEQQNLDAPIFLLPQPPATFEVRHAGYFENPPIVHTPQWRSSCHSSDIWQPPKT